MAGHPLVGAWRVAVEIPGVGDAGTNLATFTTDGTVVVAFPSPTPAAPGQAHRLEYFTPAVGAWEAAGAQGAAMTFVALGVDETAIPIGTHTITATATVAADGATWSGPFRIEIASATGAPLGAVAGTVTGTRIAAAAGGA